MWVGVWVVVVCGVLPGVAGASVFGPPAGRVFTGMTGSSSVSGFTAQVGKAPAVFGFFTSWGSGFSGIFAAARAAHARPMLHISTALNYGEPEAISPLGIARGQGDGYLWPSTRRWPTTASRSTSG